MIKLLIFFVKRISWQEELKPVQGVFQFLYVPTFTSNVQVLSIFLIVRVHGNSQVRTYLNSEQLIRSFGYPAETHYVTTDDGYVLGVQRIPSGRSQSSETSRPSVLIVHGLLGASATWLEMEPKYNLAYQLADSGFDVWLSNARGTSWSRSHKTLRPLWSEYDREKYWDFSWHEIGVYDNPAIIDYILNFKKEEKLFYVGHSQGTTTFLVMTSMRPEYNNKIKVACLLAPAASYKNVPDGSIVKFLANVLMEPIQIIATKMRIFNLSNRLSRSLCRIPQMQLLCAGVLLGDFGPVNPGLLNRRVLSNIFMNTPAAASGKQFYHYGQNMNSQTFAQYDYGKVKNLEIYGQENPPAYDLSKITAPLILYYGLNDRIVAVKDVEYLGSTLPNVLKTYRIPDKQFNHFDFVYGLNRTIPVYKQIIADFVNF